MEKKNLWTVYSEEQLAHLESLNEDYKKYLDAGKTERECVREAVKQAKEAGYRDLNEVIANGETLKAGENYKYYILFYMILSLNSRFVN